MDWTSGRVLKNNAWIIIMLNYNISHTSLFHSAIIYLYIIVYVNFFLQMLTYLSTPVTSLLMILSDEQSSFHITAEQGWKVTAA